MLGAHFAKTETPQVVERLISNLGIFRFLSLVLQFLRQQLHVDCLLIHHYTYFIVSYACDIRHHDQAIYSALQSSLTPRTAALPESGGLERKTETPSRACETNPTTGAMEFAFV